MPSGPMFFYQSGTCFYGYERLQKFMSFFIFIALKKKKSNSTDLEEKYSSKGRRMDS